MLPLYYNGVAAVVMFIYLIALCIMTHLFHTVCCTPPRFTGHSAGYQFMQFKRAIHIATWLCGAIIRGAAGGVVSKMDVHQDTPITCAKQLLRAAQVRI